MNWLKSIAEKVLMVVELTILFCSAAVAATAFIVGVLVAVQYFRNLWGI